MNALAVTGTKRRRRNPTGTGPGRRRKRRRYYAVRGPVLSLLELYGRLVSTSLAVRRERFARFVRRVTDHVKATKGWTLKRLLEEAQVTKPMYYRWLNGTWESDLEGTPIERFCDAAGVPAAEAFEILWPGKYGKREATPPMPIDPDFEAIMRALNDPNTSKEDLYLIQATFEMLRVKLGAEPRKQA